MGKYLPFDSFEIYLFISKYLMARRLFLAGKEIFSIVFLNNNPRIYVSPFQFSKKSVSRSVSGK